MKRSSGTGMSIVLSIIGLSEVIQFKFLEEDLYPRICVHKVMRKARLRVGLCDEGSMCHLSLELIWH